MVVEEFNYRCAMPSTNGDFFDDFAEVDQGLFTESDFQKFKALLLNETKLSMEDLQKEFGELVAATLQSHGITLEEAQTVATDPYVLAVTDAEAFEQLATEVAAAADCGAQVDERSEWVPPPPDDVPESAHDYE